MYVVYILQSEADNTYYVGYTKNVEKRLAQHNAGKCRYTKGHRPYRLVYSEECSSPQEAKERESKIKSYKNTKRFLEMVGSPDSQKWVGTSPAGGGGILVRQPWFGKLTIGWGWRNILGWGWEVYPPLAETLVPQPTPCKRFTILSAVKLSTRQRRWPASTETITERSMFLSKTVGMGLSILQRADWWGLGYSVCNLPAGKAGSTALTEKHQGRLGKLGGSYPRQGSARLKYHLLRSHWLVTSQYFFEKPF